MKVLHVNETTNIQVAGRSTVVIRTAIRSPRQKGELIYPIPKPETE